MSDVDAAAAAIWDDLAVRSYTARRKGDAEGALAIFDVMCALEKMYPEALATRMAKTASTEGRIHE